MLVATLRDLIRIPSINPPDPDAPDGELRVARYLADRLTAIGLVPEIVEPVPGRGSVHVRLRGDGTGGDPFLLLSHLDVVPAPADRWTHDPFAADIADGYVYGRGAVDMKGMVAMELGVVEQLVAEARAAGLDPARDPIPGLRRDVLFTCTADEEAGAAAGARWIAEHHPDWLRAAGAVNECGGVSVTVAGTRLYPIQVAEKGFLAYRIHVRGTWGHGSMPREDNAVVMAATIVDRLAAPGPVRLTPVMARFLEAAAESARRRRGHGHASDRGRRRRRGPRHRCAVRSDVRQGASGARPPDAQPGRHPRRASSTTSSRATPSSRSTAGSCRARPRPTCGPRSRRASGPTCWPPATIELMVYGEPVESPADGELYDTLVATLRDHDPDGFPVPVMAPFATDAKAAALGRARPPTASRRCAWTPTSASSSASTASMNACRSMRCASACRSCTTWSAASAPDRRPG